MKKISTFLLLLAATLFSACGGDDGLEVGSKNDAADQDQDATTLTIDSTYEYQLPVIFHVLYQDKNDVSQYIPASRIKNLLQYVNEIYRGGTYGPSANINMRFVLAETDESGKKLSTPGVEYVYYPDEYPIDAAQFMVSKDNTKYIWDPNEYINIMLYPFKAQDGGEMLGISHMPYTIKGKHELEGLDMITAAYIAKSQLGFPLCSSINSIYAGQSSRGNYYESDRYTNPDHEATFINSADIAVTIAHELGHYLGLFHVFTEESKSEAAADIFAAVDSCADTDYCTDTPTYNRNEYNEYLSSYLQASSSGQPKIYDVLKRYSCDGAEFSSTNIMDYAYTMGYEISGEQKARIRHVLYYSPLIPGPKLNGANTRQQQPTRTSGNDTILYTHPRLSY